MLPNVARGSRGMVVPIFLFQFLSCNESVLQNVVKNGAGTLCGHLSNLFPERLRDLGFHVVVDYIECRMPLTTIFDLAGV